MRKWVLVANVSWQGGVFLVAFDACGGLANLASLNYVNQHNVDKQR